MKDYVQQAMKTNSGTEKARKALSDGSYDVSWRLYKVATCGAHCDVMKSHLFYGKKKPLVVPTIAKWVDTDISDKKIHMMHGILGVSSELTELCEALEADETDDVNIKEELGDILWYVALMADQAGASMAELMEMNIAKLRTRYGDKFSEGSATTRDTEAERKVLEKPNKIQWGWMGNLLSSYHERLDPHGVFKDKVTAVIGVNGPQARIKVGDLEGHADGKTLKEVQEKAIEIYEDLLKKVAEAKAKAFETRLVYSDGYVPKYDENGVCEFKGKVVEWDKNGFLIGRKPGDVVRAHVIHTGPEYRVVVAGATREASAPTLKRAQLYALEAYEEMITL